MPTRFDLAESLLEREPLEALKRDFSQNRSRIWEEIERNLGEIENYNAYEVKNEVKEIIRDYEVNEVIDTQSFTEEVEIALEHDTHTIPIE